MTYKAILILLIILITSSVSGEVSLYNSSETIDSSVNDGILNLRISFNIEPNRGTIYQINFTNSQSSKSSVLVSYFDELSSKLISSNLSPNNESSYLIMPGDILVLSYKKLSCDLDVKVSRSAIIEISNETTALVDVNAKVTKDTGECSGDGFLPYPFIPMIFTIWIIAIIIKKKKGNKFR